MGFFLSSGCFRFIASSLFGAGKAVLRPVVCDQVPGARGRGQGTETLAKLGGFAAFLTAERRGKGSELAAVSAVLLTTLPPRSPDEVRLAGGSPKAGEPDLAQLFVQVGRGVRIRLPPPASRCEPDLRRRIPFRGAPPPLTVARERLERLGLAGVGNHVAAS